MENIPKTLEVLEKLRKNAHIGKSKHFEASDRYEYYHTALGVPVVIINIVLGSVLFILLNDDIPVQAKWIGAFLALIAAGCGALQTFFNFQKTFEGHRTIGNQYLSLARKCELFMASYFDNRIDLNQLSDEISRLQKRCNEINQAAESFPTYDKDYRKALLTLELKEKEQPSLFQRMTQVVATQNNNLHVSNHGIKTDEKS